MAPNQQLVNFSVPVELWTSTPLPPPLLDGDVDGDGDGDGGGGSGVTDLAIPGPGCDIDGETYMDGMQVGDLCFSQCCQMVPKETELVSLQS